MNKLMKYLNVIMDNHKKRIGIMNEEEKAQKAPNPKQYILVADDLHMAVLSKIMPGIQFIPVVGMGMQNNNDYTALVTPIKKDIELKPLEPIDTQV